MFTFRLVSAFVGLLLMSACGSAPTAKLLASPSNKPTSVGSPIPTAKAVLVGSSVLMRLDGTVIATLPGAGVTDEHAVGAYLMAATDGSGKGWTIDASGVVEGVAPAAVAILSPSISGGWSPPLIVDSSTAVIVRGASDGLTATAVNLRTGAVRPLLTVPSTGVMALGQALTVLDVSSDRKTVWLSKITPTGGISGRLEIIGIDLLTGTVSSHGQANPLAGAEIAVTRDGTSVAGQEEAGTNSSNLAIRHLHIVSLATGVDSDVQGTAPYVGGQRSPSVLFAPGGASVVWWGGLDNGDRSFLVNVASLAGSGRTLYNPAQIDFSFPISAVLWVDFSTLVVQNGSATYTINATTGAQTLVSHNLGALAAVLS
jgi:hypothetical protein